MCNNISNYYTGRSKNKFKSIVINLLSLLALLISSKMQLLTTTEFYLQSDKYCYSKNYLLVFDIAALVLLFTNGNRGRLLLLASYGSLFS